MNKLIYLTSNPEKVKEANRHFVNRYGFQLEIRTCSLRSQNLEFLLRKNRRTCSLRSQNLDSSLCSELKNPDFEVIEIQAKSSIDVVKYSVKYAADKLGFAVLKSDTALYIDYLGGLPGPYNAYFDKQIGVEKFLKMLKGIKNRKARLEHSFGFCEPGKEPIVFSGGSTGTISERARGKLGQWHDLFFIPDKETKTLSELREKDELYEAQFWGTAIDDFAKWYKKNINTE